MDDVEVPHLVSHVVTFDVGANGNVDKAKVLVWYSSHCWSSRWNDDDASGRARFKDGTRDRAFNPERFNASLGLPTLIKKLPEIQVFRPAMGENYGCYNSREINDEGLAYTAYFTMQHKKKGEYRFNGIRTKLLLRVQSAYLRKQPDATNSNTSLRPVIGAARHGKMVRRRRP